MWDRVTKACWKCSTEQPLENFSRNRSKSSGYAAECKACAAAYNKQHVSDNADYYREYRHAKRKANIAWYLYLEARSRAKRLALEFNLEPQDIVVPKTCPVFGFELMPSVRRDTSPSVDRIDTNRGYVKGNVQVISYMANRMKSNASDAQLRQFASWILEKSCGSERRLDAGDSETAHPHEHAH